jgi:recombination protein U
MRREQRVGKRGQNVARSVLSGRCGIRMVEKIGTPVVLIPLNLKGIPNAFRVIFEEKVSGDHRGIIGNGISVLAETKTVQDGNLQYGHLREHQPARLDEHDGNGGISLLVWVYSDYDAYVMLWPIDDFGPGKGITHERAQELNAETMEFLSWVESQRVQDWNAPIDCVQILAGGE